MLHSEVSGAMTDAIGAAGKYGTNKPFAIVEGDRVEFYAQILQLNNIYMSMENFIIVSMVRWCSWLSRPLHNFVDERGRSPVRPRVESYIFAGIVLSISLVSCLGRERGDAVFVPDDSRSARTNRKCVNLGTMSNFKS